jgi:hypothetical protein
LGTISPEEREEADAYERIGHVIGLLQAVARKSLNGSPSAA